jgi:rhamnosyltransferase
MNIIAIIVTYNPEQERFIEVFRSTIAQVDRAIIVDNDSQNKDFIKSLCNSKDNCEFIEVGFNSGIAHALRIGISYARKYNPRWLLFLDDDTIPLENAISKVMKIVNDLPEVIRQRIGAGLLGSEEGDCSIKEIRYGIFSGTLINSEIVPKVCCRDEFFLDSADHDMYSRIKELGYLTLIISCKLVDHKLGKIMWIPVISNMLRRPTYYEPSWRYYYIVRNSTRLLIEGRIDFVLYLRQIIDWGAKIIFVEGFKKFLKALGLGLMHALLNKFGYLDSSHFS